MPLTSAYAAGYRARTKVYRGTVAVNMVTFDPEEGGFVEGASVRSFEITEPYLSEGITTSDLKVAEDAIATPALLANCQFTVDGEFYKVVSRVEPIGANRRTWMFRIERTGSFDDIE